MMSQQLLISSSFISSLFFFFAFCSSSCLPPRPPPRPSSFHFHFTKRPTSFYHCGFENRQGEKCLKVLGIQLFHSMNLGRSLKSVLPFIVPCGKICSAKVSGVKQPMTWYLCARILLAGVRKTQPTHQPRRRERGGERQRERVRVAGGGEKKTKAETEAGIRRGLS